MTRTETLWKLAELYPLIACTLNGPDGSPGDGNAIALTDPTAYTSTVREFERLCRKMRDDRHESLMKLPSGEKVSVRSAYWHLNEWHLKATRVPHHTRIPDRKNQRARVPAGQNILRDRHGNLVPSRAAIRILRNPAANEHKARLACDWIARNWTLAHDPQLPATHDDRRLIAA